MKSSLAAAFFILGGLCVMLVFRERGRQEQLWLRHMEKDREHLFIGFQSNHYDSAGNPKHSNGEGRRLIEVDAAEGDSVSIHYFVPVNKVFRFVRRDGKWRKIK